MGKLNSFITMKPPKSSRAKKDTASEKEKESLSPVHETLPEVGVVAAEPAVPRKTRYSKKSSAPKEQGIVLKEVSSEKPKSPLVPAGDKGKVKLVEEASPPSKRQKIIHLPEVVVEPLAPEVELKNMITSYLSLDDAAGSSGQMLSTQAITSAVESLNLMSGELWNKLQNSGFDDLLELSVRTSIVVRISLYCCVILSSHFTITNI